MEGTDLRSNKPGRHAATEESEADTLPPAPVPPALGPRDPGQGMLFGELLVDQQLIGPSQLAEALLQQSASGKRLGALLVELGAVDDLEVARVLSIHLNVPFSDLRRDSPADEAIELVPEAIARSYQAIPMEVTEDGLEVAMADPLDTDAIAKIRDASGMSVVPMIAPPSDIRRATDKSYKALASIGRHVDAFLATEALTSRSLDEEAAPDLAPVVQVVHLIITQGVRDRASDIHIEPQDSRVRVR